MNSFQLEFTIDQVKIDTFLLGSKSYFETVVSVIHLFSKAIDVGVEVKYKLVELDKSKVVYNLKLIIDYPIQGLLWGGFNKKQINLWFKASVNIALNYYKGDNDIEMSLDEIANDLGLDNNFIYLKISDKNLKKNLEEIKKLSILLFKNLYYFESKDREIE